MVKTKENKVPTGIKIISVLYIIFGIIGLLIGITFVLGSSASDIVLKDVPELVPFGFKLLILFGVIVISVGVFTVLSGIYLWKMKKWARISIIVISIFSILRSIISLSKGDILSAVLGFVISLSVISYLMLNKNIKTMFTNIS